MSYTWLIFSDKQIRLVLIGKTGVGKSSTANTLMGGNFFKTDTALDSVTSNCDWRVCTHNSITYKFIDTPGFMDTGKDKFEVCREVAMSLQFAAPGPHIFLIVVKFGRYTQEDQMVIAQMKELFGNDFMKDYGVLVFTHGDDIKHHLTEGNDDDIDAMSFFRACEERFNKGAAKIPQLRELRSACSGRVFYIDNRARGRAKKDEASRFYDQIQRWGLGGRYCIDKHRLAEMMEEDKRKRNEKLEKQLMEQRNKAERERLRRVEKQVKRKERQAEELQREFEQKQRELKDRERELERQREHEKREQELKNRERELELQREYERRNQEMRNREREIERVNEMKQRECERQRIEHDKRKETQAKLEREYKLKMEEMEKQAEKERSRIEEEYKRKEEEREKAFQQKKEEPVEPSEGVLSKIGNFVKKAATVVLKVAKWFFKW